jgi:hypothetical protein
LGEFMGIIFERGDYDGTAEGRITY